MLTEIKTPSAANKIKLLIADDDAPTRILLRAAVLQWNYEVIEAKDGEEAWNLLKSDDSLRLLIVDWLMPKMDGLELCKRCRTELKTHPYIIFLTQLAGATNLMKGLEAGADEFLSKPFNMAELRSRLAIGSRIIQYDLEAQGKDNELQAYIKEMDNRNKHMMELLLKAKQQLEEINGDEEKSKRLKIIFKEMIDQCEIFRHQKNNNSNHE